MIASLYACRRLRHGGRLSAGLLLVLLCIGLRVAYAAELRIVDASGLVRAVKVVRGPARIVIHLQSTKGHTGAVAVRGECTAVNIDGLSAEKKSAVDPRNECVFDQMSEGAWQIRVPDATTWKVQVNE
jgi:hypothetical protein